jgi:hypothetical protein
MAPAIGAIPACGQTGAWPIAAMPFAACKRRRRPGNLEPSVSSPWRLSAATSAAGRQGQGGSGNVVGSDGSEGLDSHVQLASVSAMSSISGADTSSIEPAAQRGTQPHASTQLLLPPPELRPNHLAIILDGNHRWAAARGVPTAFGYQAGVEALRSVVQCCHAWRIPCLTVSLCTGGA